MRRVIVGVGCDMRGDDAVGPEVVRRLRAGALPGGTVTAIAASPVDLIDLWEGAALAVAVDAVVTGARPGTLHRFEQRDLDRVAGAGHPTSGHGLEVAEAVALSRALDRMPERLVIVGVEGASFAHGTPMNAEVAAAVEPAAALILDVLGADA